MKLLKDLWRALTTPAESTVSACNYGVPLRSEPDIHTQLLRKEYEEAQAGFSKKIQDKIDADIIAQLAEYDKAAKDALIYGTGAVKIEYIPSMDPDIKREVRTLKVGDYEINPISGIPYTDAERKEWQLDTFMFEYFPDAWLAVVQVAIAGNKQHNPGQPLHWARGKSTDQFNTAFRHYWERRRGVHKDTDGQPHLAKAIWRLMARLQLDIEEDRK